MRRLTAEKWIMLVIEVDREEDKLIAPWLKGVNAIDFLPIELLPDLEEYMQDKTNNPKFKMPLLGSFDWYLKNYIGVIFKVAE